MSNLYESDVEYFDAKPRPPKHPDTPADQVWAEREMWRARALQNRAEFRALQAETAGRIAKVNREARNLRQRLEAAEARAAELEENR